MKYKLNKTSRKLVENAVGLVYGKIENYDAITIDNEIEKKKKKKLRHSASKEIELESRGTPLIFFGRFKEENDMEKDISNILKKM